MTAPVITSATNGPFPCTVEVQFSQNMLNNAALLSPSTYMFNHGAYSTVVALLDSSRVRITVENLFGYSSFTLTAQYGLKSDMLEDLDTNVTASFSVDLPPDGFNIISASNGRLKSGKVAKKVFGDYNNWYVMTEGGIDIIDKISLFNKGYILQEYGFTSIFVTKE